MSFPWPSPVEGEGKEGNHKGRPESPGLNRGPASRGPPGLSLPVRGMDEINRKLPGKLYPC